MIDHFVITSWGRSTYNATSCFFLSQQRWNHIHIELLQWQGTSGIQNWKRKDLIFKTYKRIEQKPWHKKKLFPLCSLATVKVTLANIYRIELPKLGLQRRQKLKALLVFK